MQGLPKMCKSTSIREKKYKEKKRMTHVANDPFLLWNAPSRFTKGQNVAQFASDFIGRGFAKLLPPAFFFEGSSDVLKACTVCSVTPWGTVATPYRKQCQR